MLSPIEWNQKNSPDDSSSSTTSNKINNKSKNNASRTATNPLPWNRLGLLTELCSCLQEELNLPMPTPVQSLVIPQLLKTEKDSIAFLAATGYVVKIKNKRGEGWKE